MKIAQYILPMFIVTLVSCSTIHKSVNTEQKISHFEGITEYAITGVKPDLQLSDNIWTETIKKLYGKRGHQLHQEIHGRGEFFSLVYSGQETGYQEYISANKEHISYQLGNPDTIYQKSIATNQFIKIDTIVLLKQQDTINNIPCKIAIVKLNIGKYRVWYNESLLPIQPNLYSGTLFSKTLIDRIKCLPIKLESDLMEINLLNHKDMKWGSEEYRQYRAYLEDDKIHREIQNKNRYEQIQNKKRNNLKSLSRPGYPGTGEMPEFLTKIQFDNTHIDFDTLLDNTMKMFEINFTNIGENDLHIVKARGSCGCTVVTEIKPKKIYHPGESGSIIVRFETWGKAGTDKSREVEYFINIESNTNPIKNAITFKGTLINADE